MSRQSKQKPVPSEDQITLDFEEVIKSAQILSRDEVVAKTSQENSQQDYSPVDQTADYMRRAVQFEEAWESTIQKAREALLTKDARDLYLEFFIDLKDQIEQSSPQTLRLITLLEQVGIRGFGMTKQQIRIIKPPKGGTSWRVELDIDSIQSHLKKNIIGPNFLNPVTVEAVTWKKQTPLIGASDVSQHRSAVPIPARFFKRSVPFVLNNAAGTLFRIKDGQPKYDNVFNPKPDDTLLRWMLIDPSYQDELEPEDYERCVASAMDVGQYKFDLEYLLKADKRPPDIIFRDGSLFPQDAYLNNFVIESKRGDFTREAIIELLNCLTYARDMEVVYCGVSKNVQLKVYSAVLDWFIAKYIDANATIGNYTLNDGQAMSLLLATPSFVGNNLQQTVSTCLIRRCFTTRANLNTRANMQDLDSYFRLYEHQHDVDVDPFRRLCRIADVYMFFVGHSKSPQQQLPRYEFFHTESQGPTSTVTQKMKKVVAALQDCGLMNDNDHSFMADKPVTFLIPSVTQQAHLLSKDVGKYIDTATGRWIMSRYQNLLPKGP